MKHPGRRAALSRAAYETELSSGEVANLVRLGAPDREAGYVLAQLAEARRLADEGLIGPAAAVIDALADHDSRGT